MPRLNTTPPTLHLFGSLLTPFLVQLLFQFAPLEGSQSLELGGLFVFLAEQTVLGVFGVGSEIHLDSAGFHWGYYSTVTADGIFYSREESLCELEREGVNIPLVKQLI